MSTRNTHSNLQFLLAATASDSAVIVTDLETRQISLFDRYFDICVGSPFDVRNGWVYMNYQGSLLYRVQPEAL